MIWAKAKKKKNSYVAKCISEMAAQQQDVQPRKETTSSGGGGSTVKSKMGDMMGAVGNIAIGIRGKVIFGEIINWDLKKSHQFNDQVI